MPADFTRDDAWQRSERDTILAPGFYKRYAAGGRYVFVNGAYDGPWLGGGVRSDPNGNDKRFHRWGQSGSGMADLIRKVSKPCDVICDPFLGGGTTAVVALGRGRRFVGSDIDLECVRRSLARLSVEIADAAA